MDTRRSRSPIAQMPVIHDIEEQRKEGDEAERLDGVEQRAVRVREVGRGKGHGHQPEV